MRMLLAALVLLSLAGCASPIATTETPPNLNEPATIAPNQNRRLGDWLGKDPNLEELRERRKQLETSQAEFERAMDGPKTEHPLSRFERIATQTSSYGASPYDNSYNPELRNMGFRMGADGKLKSMAGDGERDVSWEELRAAQGFGR